MNSEFARARRQAALFHSRKQRRSREALAPHCTVGPVITGTFQSGQNLSVSDGTWLQSPTITYQWMRGTTARNLSPITGETADTYTVLAGDVGKVITCAVIGTNSVGARSCKAVGSVVT